MAARALTSTSNAKVKYVRRLLSDRRFRRREQAYVVEGSRWLTEVIQTGIRPHFILATGNWLADDNNSRLLEAVPAPAFSIDDQLMAHTSEAVTPPGILVVLPMSSTPLPDQPTLLLVLDGIANPGNMGTLARTAAAAGADGILLGPGCVDVYNPKVVQGSMGAHLRLPVVEAGWDEIALLTPQLAIWIAAGTGTTRYDRVNWREPSAIIIGSEASGASEHAHRLTSRLVSIPMARSTESLNAAVAGAILLFEAARQRDFRRL